MIAELSQHVFSSKLKVKYIFYYITMWYWFHFCGPFCPMSQESVVCTLYSE